MMTNTMTVIDFFRNHGEFVSKFTYGENGFVYPSRNPSDKRRGVYMKMSRHGIEKIGKAEQNKGLQARTSQYGRFRKRIREETSDPSDRLWESADVLHKETMDLYFYPCPSEQVSVEGLTIENDFIRPLEKFLSKQAREEGHPMRLAGKGD